MTGPSTVPQWYRRPEFWVAIISLTVRLWFLQVFYNSPFFEPIKNGNDRSLYHQLAQTIAKGGVFPQGVFEYMPLYPTLLGWLYKLSGPDLYLAALVGCLLDTTTTYLVFIIARKYGASIVSSSIVAVLYAFYPLAIIYSVQTMANTLNGCLLISFVACATCVLERRKPLGFLLLGLLAGLTSLTFAGMLLVGVVSAMYFLYRGFIKKAFNPSFVLLFGAGMFLPILPFTIHNWNAEHRFVLITGHGGFNFYMGNHEGATGYSSQIKNFRGDSGSLLADARAEAEKVAGRKLSTCEVSKYWSDQAWEFIKSHPAEEIKLLGIKFLKFWNRLEYDDLRLLPMIQLTGTGFTWNVWPGFFIFGVLGFLGLFFVNRGMLIKIVTATCMLSLVSFFITARYRLALVPLLSVLGAFALDFMIENFRTRNWLRMALPIVGVVIVAIPMPQSDFRALDYYNTSAYLVARGNYRAARELSDRGIEVNPAVADLWFVRGNSLFLLQDFPLAKESFEKAIQLKPGFAAAHFNLAQTFNKMSDPASARREATLALQLDPEHQQAREFLKSFDQQSR